MESNVVEAAILSPAREVRKSGADGYGLPLSAKRTTSARSLPWEIARRCPSGDHAMARIRPLVKFVSLVGWPPSMGYRQTFWSRGSTASMARPSADQVSGPLVVLRWAARNVTGPRPPGGATAMLQPRR